MNRTIWTAIAAALIAACIAVGAQQEARTLKDTRPAGSGVWIDLDRVSYEPGDPVQMRMTVFNTTPEQLTIQFGSSQQFDFRITDSEGEQVWRWADGKVFTAMVGQEKVGPGKECITYRASFEGKLTPGTYLVTGEVTSFKPRMSAAAVLRVK